jgi:Uma2 family endonuclease
MAQGAVLEEAAQAQPAAAPSATPKMTYEEFLEWADEDTSAEWVNGEIVMASPASVRHQQVSKFLCVLLEHYVQAHTLGEILPAPFQMKTGAALPGREPDLLFIANEHLDRLKNTYLDGAADLAVEIISPESRARDRGEKFYEYEQGGVREYWLIDPLRKQADFYQLGADGIYRTAQLGADGVFRSAVLEGLWLRVDWLWQDPLPLLLSVLKEWKLI